MTDNLILYTTDDGAAQIQLRALDGSAWLTAAQMAELFNVTAHSVHHHIRALNAERELDITKCKKLLQQPGQSRRISHYNLDVILAVGYRVRGPRGNQFRTWATTILSEYLIKGFAIDDERLKNPYGGDYFDELLARIREIRASEARFYAKIRELFALSADYEPQDQECRRTFQTIQDKLHYAITGLTAAEVIATRCDPSRENLGLTNFKGNRVTKADVTVAKNYLSQDEMARLNRLVTQYLDYAEDQAERGRVIYMQNWVEKTEGFIRFNDYPVLEGHGRIRRKTADAQAHERYEVFAAQRRRSEYPAQQELESMKAIEQRIIADRKRLTPRK